MMWSKLKKVLGERRAPALGDRLVIHATRYRRAHDQAGRVWFTFDGREFLDLSDRRFEREYYGLVRNLQEMNRSDYRDPETRAVYYEAYGQARRVMSSKGNLAGDHFLAAAETFINLPIEEALASDNPLIRGLAVIDRRFGKKKLQEITESADQENSIVRELLRVRCTAEKVRWPFEPPAV